MHVLIKNEQSALPVSEESLQVLLLFLVHLESVDCDELSLHLIDDQRISRMHSFYFQDPSPTDCISFPIDAPGQREDGVCFLGEIFVSTETAINYSKTHQIDPYEELTLYIVHGFLHLLGYDDIEVDDQKEMREKEKYCIDNLAKENIFLKRP